MTDRAVSNVLGFVLLFAVVFASLTAAATLGVSSLTAARDTTVTMNAEQSMEGMAASLADINRNNVSARTATIRMGAGTLESADDAEIVVNVTHDGSTTSVVDTTFQPIRYRFQDTEIVYSLGSVLRTQESGERVVHDPTMVFEKDVVILPVLITEAEDSDRGVAGSTTVVYAQRTGQNITHIPDSGAASDVTVDIEIDTTERRAELWNDTLKDEMDSCTINAGGTGVDCDFATNDGAAVIVRRTNVIYEFGS